MAAAAGEGGIGAELTPGAKVGDTVEFSPASSALAHEIATRVVESGGAAAFIDYGHDGNAGLSLRGIRDHAFVDPLSAPGDTDLSVDVDFAALRQAVGAAGARGWGPVTQSEFLQSLGIVARFEKLLEGATEEQAARLQTEMRRLLHPDEMGSIYKVLAVTAEASDAPIGFGGGLGE
uniref:Protein arginine methyltransferase NDUFAF7 n=1 Tax=Bicosoecida sp. CB-2014 TaxID=1486930 RepID=A0A7S1CJ23_9STRA